MQTSFEKMINIVYETFSANTKKVTREDLENNTTKIKAIVTDETIIGESPWKVHILVIIITERLVRFSLFYCNNSKFFKFSDNALMEQYIFQNIEINNRLDIGMFKCNFQKKVPRFEISFDYGFLHDDYWKAMFQNILKFSLEVVREYKSEIIQIFEGHYIEKPRKKKLEFQKISQEDLELKEHEEIDKDIVEKFKQVPNHELINFDNVYELINSDIIVYTYYKWSMLDSVKSGLFNIDSESLIEFMKYLVKFQEEEIFFKSFPSKSIEYRRPLEGRNVLKLGFRKISKHLPGNFEARKKPYEYQADLNRSLTTFLIDCVMKKLGQTTLSNLDLIDPIELENSIIENGKHLGKGGFGQVYLNEYCGNQVAIKLSLDNRADVLNSKIISEYFLMRNVSHPYLIKTFGCVVYQGKIGIVMEYCPNGSLSSHFKEHYLTSEPRGNPHNLIDESGETFKTHLDCLKFLQKIAHGLNYLHLRKYAHFDMKPHNIFLSQNFEPKIADFGLSRLILSNSDKKAAGCSLYYCPPEQIFENSPDQSADVWGFGMIMYFVLLKKYPFEEMRIEFKQNPKNEKQKYYKYVYNDLVRPIIPEEFEDTCPREAKLIRECWISDKEKRPKMGKITKELTRIIEESREIG